MPESSLALRALRKTLLNLTRRCIEAARGQGVSEADLQGEIGDVGLNGRKVWTTLGRRSRPTPPPHNEKPFPHHGERYTDQHAGRYARFSQQPSICAP